MGHLINATALRVGWFLNWTDSWYSDYVYYAEFLHMIFRIRLFLFYFFSSKRFERNAYFFSHFEIVQKYSDIFVNVYIYDGAVEGLMDDLFVEYYVEARRFRKDYKKRDKVTKRQSWKTLIVLNFMHQINLYEWPLHRLSILWRAFKYLKRRPLLRFLNHSKFVVRARGARPRLIFFLLLFANLKSIISKNFVKNRIGVNIVLSRFIYILSWSFWNYALFFHLSLFLSFVFCILNPKIIKTTVNFFSITGSCINAKFLSRYLARKLKQGYSVKELLNPIKKELTFVGFVTKYPLSNYLYSINKLSILKNQVLDYRKAIFKYLFAFMLALYAKFFFFFYRNTFMWVFLDVFSALKLMSKSSSVFNSKICVYLSKNYVKNRAALHFAFFSGRDYLGAQFSTLFIDSAIKLWKRIGLFEYIDFILNDLYSNFNLLLSLFRTFFYNTKFFSSNIFVNKIFINSYWVYNYNYLSAKVNKRFLRKPNLGRYGNLIGFKFHCLGRFSRKERASSIWFRQVKVPLNTLNAFIDYAFFTVPLRNSSATVKIWLYCSFNMPKFYFKIV